MITIEIQINNLILAKRENLAIFNQKWKRIKTKIKRTCRIVADHRVKLKEGEKRDKYLDLDSEHKKLWNFKVTVKLIVVCALGTTPKELVKGLEIRNQRASRDHLEYSITKIGENTEKSPGDLRRLSVTQTQLKNP